LLSSSIKIQDIKVLHYQFVDFQRMLRKQRWARLLEFGHYKQRTVLNCIILNNKYFITKNEKFLKVSKVPESWLSGYPKFSLGKDSSMWHVSKSIEFIKEYGVENLYWLDIWDYKWPSEFPDKRNWVQKIYHKNQYLLYLINLMIPKKIKNMIK